MRNISTRAFVRIISFFIAIAAALAGLAWQRGNELTDLKLQVKYGYMRAMEDLSLSVENIKTSLNKGVYASSPEYMTDLSGKLWSDASTAKVSLSQLPMAKLNLENTYKFLSQVGNYSKSLSQKCANGESLTDEEKQNISTLLGYCTDISQSLWDTINQINNGYITFDDVTAESIKAADDASQEPANIADSFRSVEDGFQEYPTLIYDGPFSDHLMQKSPAMLEGLEEITLEQAKAIAEKAAKDTGLEQGEDEAGKMPSYVFQKDNITVGVTKQGGLLTYMLKYRQVGDNIMSAAEAVKTAKQYLSTLGVYDVTETYYEIQNGVCVINFAGFVNDVTMYTDLIKVGVALDNGEIMSYDGRGYITNKTNRQLNAPTITAEQARQAVSTALSIEGTKLCLIPSEGQNEIYCYEFRCSSYDGQQVLVYVNAETGKEEKILMLLISENGTLTA